MHNLAEKRNQLGASAATQETAESLRQQGELPRIPIALPDHLQLAAGDFGGGDGDGVHLVENELEIDGGGGNREHLIVETCE